jgi:hypothetical protein
MRVRGLVERARVGRGTKSEHTRVVLRTADAVLWLRRRGEHPFVDPILDRLVGETIRASGSVHGNTFLLDDWTVVKRRRTRRKAG